jgi:hypothetical protein
MIGFFFAARAISISDFISAMAAFPRHLRFQGDGSD